MLDDLLELVLDVGGELLFSRKKGEQGKPEGQPSVPDGGRRQQKTAFQPGKDPWEYPGKKTTLGEMRIDMFDLDQLFQKSELIPVIIQHARTKDVLMLGFTNREAVERTLQTKTAWFWSRSRGKLWNKGETSGHFLHVEQIFTDCDTDTLLYFCLPDGPTCHTGRDSCFFQEIML